MSEITVVTGGARSGKSRFAENLCLDFGQTPCYIATAQSFDNEMEQRIASHRSRRGDLWDTIEEPQRLSQTLSGIDGRYSCILVDCLTIWLTNLLLSYENIADNPEREIRNNVQELVKSLELMKTPVLLVTNEVGQGIVPENRLARAFRDLAGEANQMIAAVADHVYVVISGIPLKLK